MQTASWRLYRRLLGILLILLVSSWGLARDSRSKRNDPIDFTLKDIKGDTVRLKDYRGKWVLINIWATWCGPCRAEIPDLIRIRNRYKDKGFEILGVVVASRSEDVKAMVEKMHINYPVLWGTKEALAQFGEIPAIPRTFLLNPDGRIVEDLEGSRDFQFFNRLIGRYLTE